MADEIKVTCGLCPGTFEMQNANLNPGAVAVLLEAWQGGHKHDATEEDRAAWAKEDGLAEPGKVWEDLKKAFKP